MRLFPPLCPATSLAALKMVAGGMLPTFDDDEQYDTNSEKGVGEKTKAVAGQQGPPSIIYLMSLLSAMGGFLFGYDTGIVSGAMVFVRKIFNLNSVWQELVVSITILGAWILSIMAGSLSERYGRKAIILIASVIFTIGSIIMGAAWSKWVLLFGRLIVGAAIGLSSTVVPMYIAELAPASIRGSLVTMNNCFVTVGQLSAAVTAGAFSYDHENGWRWMLGLAAVPAGIQFAGFLFMPESPRWLIRHQRENEALVALKKIRGNQNQHAIMREFEKMRQNQLELVVQEDRRKEQRRNIIVAILRKTATRRALFVGCLLMAAQQLAGINTVMYYTATIIEMSGVQSQSAAVWLAVPTAAIYVLFSFGGYLIVDRLGRRTLTLGSLLGVILSLLLLGTGFHLTSMNGAEVTALNMSTLEACYSKRDCTSCIADPRCGFCYDTKNIGFATCLERNPHDPAHSIGGDCAHEIVASRFAFAEHICPSKTQGIGMNTWLVLSGLVLYLASFAPGMGPMPWTINSEIYPSWARSFCYSIATSVNWLFCMVISLTFITLTEVLTPHGTFYLYTIISSIFWLLLFWKLPETRGRSLEDIATLFVKAKQPDDQDIIDGMSSANQSTVGGGAGGGGAGGNQTGDHHQSQRHNLNSFMCHDNLAFATENMAPLNFQATKSVPIMQQSNDQLERSRSFKQAGSLLGKQTSTTAALNMALSQPDLQQPAQNIRPTGSPEPPALSTFGISNVITTSGQPLEQHYQNQLYHFQQQQQQSKRKYSNGGEM